MTVADQSKGKEALCYVLMPFSHDLDGVYNDAIKAAVHEALAQLDRTIRCLRGDDAVHPGSVTREIVNSIYAADVVIADLTGNNPNVFYELGVAHSLGKNTALITQNIEGSAFDVQGYRQVRYESSPAGLLRLRTQLANVVVQVLSGHDAQPSNPVQDFIRTPHSNVLRMEELVVLEGEVARDVWLIEPSLETDIRHFREVIRKNIEQRSVNYRFMVPDKPEIRRAVRKLREMLAVDDTAWRRIAIRVIEPMLVESEIVVYDANMQGQQVFLISSPDEGPPFFFRIKGVHANSIRDRYESLWEERAKPVDE